MPRHLTQSCENTVPNFLSHLFYLFEGQVRIDPGQVRLFSLFSKGQACKVLAKEMIQIVFADTCNCKMFFFFFMKTYFVC